MPWEKTGTKWQSGKVTTGLMTETSVHGNFAHTFPGTQTRIYKVIGSGVDQDSTNGFTNWRSYTQTTDQYDAGGYPFKTVQYPSVIIHHMRANVVVDKGSYSYGTSMDGFWAASPQRSRMMSSRLTNLRHGVAPR